MVDETVTGNEGQEQPSEEKPLTHSQKLEIEYNKIKETNDKMQEELFRGQKLKAELALAGTAGIGQILEPPREETPAEYAAKVLRGELN